MLIRLSAAGIDFVDCCFEGSCFEMCFVFNWRFYGRCPDMEQFEKCEYRGRNVGLGCPPSS
jgi:hypothetical protein